MVSVWEWVGIVLGVYGVIILISAFVYPVESHSYVINPSFWWGGFMLGFAFLIYRVGKTNRSGKNKRSENQKRGA